MEASSIRRERIGPRKPHEVALGSYWGPIRVLPGRYSISRRATAPRPCDVTHPGAVCPLRQGIVGRHHNLKDVRHRVAQFDFGGGGDNPARRASGF